MTGNQEAHCILVFGFQAEATEYGLRGLETSFNVVLRGETFANIVQKKRQKQELGFFDSIKNVPETPIQFFARVAERMQVFDRDD
jgi:hypothetical protein